MFGMLLKLILLAAIGLPALFLAVVNSHKVRLVLDPFTDKDPALVVEPPLFALLFGAVLVGILIGGSATWFNQARWRRTARQKGREAIRWHKEADRLSRQIEAAAQARIPHPGPAE